MEKHQANRTKSDFTPLKISFLHPDQVDPSQVKILPQIRKKSRFRGETKRKEGNNKRGGEEEGAGKKYRRQRPSKIKSVFR